jgi:hypothetical protein
MGPGNKSRDDGESLRSVPGQSPPDRETVAFREIPIKTTLSLEIFAEFREFGTERKALVDAFLT